MTGIEKIGQVKGDDGQMPPSVIVGLESGGVPYPVHVLIVPQDRFTVDAVAPIEFVLTKWEAVRLARILETVFSYSTGGVQ